MPTLFVLNGWKIQMFARERERAHFHVVKGDEEYRYSLVDMCQMATDDAPTPPGIDRMVRRWAERNRTALEAAWVALREGEAVDLTPFVD